MIGGAIVVVLQKGANRQVMNDLLKGKTYPQREGIIVLLFALAALAINWKLIREGIILSSYDIWHHVKWVNWFSQQLTEGIIYPRWLAQSNYGYGSPTFIFYPPLAYYVGSLLRGFGLNAEQTIIALFILPTWLAGITMYLYGRQRWGIKTAVFGGLLYLSMPYLAVNIYLRGALAETWAIAFLPLLFHFTDQSLLSSRGRVGLIVAFALLSFTHLPSLLIYTLAWLIYIFYCYCTKKLAFKRVLTTLICSLISWGIAAFYLLPAIHEKSWVNLASMKAVSGGYQANLIGTPQAHSFLPTVSKSYFYGVGLTIFLAILAIWIYRSRKNILLCLSQSFLVLAIIIFLMSYPSKPIWTIIPTLQMLQFPWRLLGLFSFIFVCLVAQIMRYLTLAQRWIYLLIPILILLLNYRYAYQMSKNLATFANYKNRYKIEEIQKVKNILNNPHLDNLSDVPEYRPLLPNRQPAPKGILDLPQVFLIKGKGNITIEKWGSYQRRFNIKVDQPSLFKIRTYYYPAWHLYLNQKPHPIKQLEDGTIGFNLASGFHELELRYQWTLAFTIGVGISLLTIVFLLINYQTKWIVL